MNEKDEYRIIHNLLWVKYEGADDFVKCSMAQCVNRISFADNLVRDLRDELLHTKQKLWACQSRLGEELEK